MMETKKILLPVIMSTFIYAAVLAQSNSDDDDSAPIAQAAPAAKTDRPLTAAQQAAMDKFRAQERKDWEARRKAEQDDWDAEKKNLNDQLAYLKLHPNEVTAKNGLKTGEEFEVHADGDGEPWILPYKYILNGERVDGKLESESSPSVCKMPPTSWPRVKSQIQVLGLMANGNALIEYHYTGPEEDFKEFIQGQHVRYCPDEAKMVIPIGDLAAMKTTKNTNSVKEILKGLVNLATNREPTGNPGVTDNPVATQRAALEIPNIGPKPASVPVSDSAALAR